MQIKVKLLKDWTNPADGKEYKVEDGKDIVLDLDPAVAKTLFGLGIAEEVATQKTAVEEIDAALDGIEERVTDAVLAGVQKAAKALPGKAAAAIATGGGDRSDEDPMGGFKCDDEFFLAVHRSAAPGAVADERLAKIATVHKRKMLDRYPQIGESAEARAKVAAVGTGEAGGFLIPEETSNRIFSRMQMRLGGLMGQCDNITLTGFSVRMAAVSDASRYASSTRYGGIVVYNVAEAGSITESDLKFREIQLQVHKKACLAGVTDEMLSVVANFGSRLTTQMGDAIGDEVIEDMLFGSGAGVCLGMLHANNKARLSIAKEDDQEADTIVAENIINMEAALYGEGEFFYNPECHTQLSLLTLTVGTSGIPLMLSAGGFSNAPYTTIRGRRATKTDHCEALGDVGDFALINPTQYMLATRGGVETEISIHLWFDYAKTAFRATFEIDGKPAWETTQRPRKGAAATRISPFVVIAERA